MSTRVSPAEAPFFFGDPNQPLFGVLHEAAEFQAEKRPFVFCHPFGEEKLWTHRVFVSFARELARRGHCVLRFDFRGNGDSSGEFSDSSISTALQDLTHGVDVVRKRTGSQEVSLLGLRLGATLAGLAAEQIGGVGSLVMWAPILDGRRYMQELLRGNLATQMAVYKEIRQDRDALVEAMKRGDTVNVDGYELGYQLYEQASAIKLTTFGDAFAGGTLIVQADRRPNVPVGEDVKALGRRYQNASVVSVTEEPFWKEIDWFYETAPQLAAVTLSWLEAECTE